MTTFTASLELDDEEASDIRVLAERHGVTIEALLNAALRTGLDDSDGVLVRLGVYDPRRASPLLNPTSPVVLADDDFPF